MLDFAPLSDHCMLKFNLLDTIGSNKVFKFDMSNINKWKLKVELKELTSNMNTEIDYLNKYIAYCTVKIKNLCYKCLAK